MRVKLKYIAASAVSGIIGYTVYKKVKARKITKMEQIVDDYNLNHQNSKLTKIKKK